MIIGELSLFTEISTFTNVAPFTFQCLPALHTTANYWIDTFGAEDESISIIKNITAFINNSIYNYSYTNSLTDCIDTVESFFWDAANQILYIHFDHDVYYSTDKNEYSNSRGFTDSGVVYIDSLYYMPAIKSIPGIEQQQDLINYDKLAFISGSGEHNNVGGQLDFLIDIQVMGNDYRLYHLQKTPGVYNYTRDDLTSLAAFFIEDYSVGLSKVDFDFQDIRKKQNVKILDELFSQDDYPNLKDEYVDDPIPLAYGIIRISEAIPVDGEAGSGTTTYRQALYLSSLGTVQVEIDGKWTTKATASTDLDNGSFTLSEANSRKANGEPYKCRVVNSIGYTVTYASDVIKYLNLKYLSIKYINSLYDTDEWEEEETQLETIGILFNKRIELFEAIRLVQAGANKGFRYEIKPDGRRTIRIDDWDRDVSYRINNSIIKDIDDIEVKTNHELLAAYVEIKYGKDYINDKYYSYINSDYADDTIENNRQYPTITMETALPLTALAVERAEYYASRLYQIHSTVELKIMGTEWYDLRIYDIIEVELTPALIDGDSGEILDDGREFYGIWKAQVLSINPDFDGLLNNINVILIEQLEAIEYVLTTEDDKIILLEGTEKIKIALEGTA